MLLNCSGVPQISVLDLSSICTLAYFTKGLTKFKALTRALYSSLRCLIQGSSEWLLVFTV